MFTLKLEVMETTINTFGKFKEYKEKRVRELIRKYNVFMGTPWGLIIVICGICCLFFFLLLLFLFNLIHEDYSIWLFLFENLSLLFALIISLAFTILAIVKYIRSLQVQKVVYDCLNCLSDFESEMCSKIELDTLRKQMQVNNNEIGRLTCLSENLDLKCKIINKILWINYRKSFICTLFSMNLDEYKKMIKNKTVLLQERCSYQQLQNKYKADIQLLKTKNEDLGKRVETIEKTVADDKQKSTNVDIEETKNEDLGKRVETIEKTVVDDKQILKNIDEKLNSALKCKILKSEIRLFFTDLIEVVSQIKIQ